MIVLKNCNYSSVLINLLLLFGTEGLPGDQMQHPEQQRGHQEASVALVVTVLLPGAPDPSTGKHFFYFLLLTDLNCQAII